MMQKVNNYAKKSDAKSKQLRQLLIHATLSNYKNMQVTVLGVHSLIKKNSLLVLQEGSFYLSKW